MNPLRRRPSGQFIWSANALEAWMPTMLDHIFEDNALATALRLMVTWAAKQQAKRLRDAAHVIEKEQDAAWWLRMADVWAKRRAILLNAAKELAEVRS